ncbi:MAG: M36 family metallopeptidase, partial [Parafilimonas sp.]
MRKIVLLMFLTPLFLHAQNQSSEDYFKNLVKKNAAEIGLSAYDIQNNRLSDFYYDAHAKTYMVYLIQTFKGVDVDDVLSPLSFKEDKLITGHFITLNEIKEKAKNISEKPSVTASASVMNAAKDIGLSTSLKIVPSALSNNGKKAEFNIPDISQNKITANLKWRTPDNINSNYTLVWQTLIHTNNNNALWLVNIDAATGAVIDKKNLTTYENSLGINKTHHNMYVYEDDKTNNAEIRKVESVSSAKYRVVNFPAESPIVTGGTPALATDPWTMFPNTKAITLKWNSDNTKDYDSAFGNNTHVVDDEDNNNVGGVSAHSISALPNLDFDHSITYGLPTDQGNNRESGLTNLFYWTNLMHDMSYQYGFDEPAGNFQSTNFGRGGAENDYVNADAQDGSGIDNSNFSTPVDGSKPRMQMYFFQPNPDTVLKINSPAAYSGFQLSSLGEISLTTQKAPITSDIVMYNDNAGSSHTACVAPLNGAALIGKIVYVDRGSCSFDEKILNAQKAGAAAVIVGDTVDVANSTLINMIYKTNVFGQTIFDKAVTIPSSFVRSGDALTIKSYLKGGTAVNATFYSQLTDGELDNGVVCHEYTHGISTRLTGGPNNGTCLTNGEAMNEGWSDYFAIMMTKDWTKAKLTDGALPKTVGNYAIGFPADGPGIRFYPYSTDKTINPETYDFVLSSDGETHTIGEVWCEMLWEMTWQIIQDIGTINTQLSNADAKGGNSIALNLMMEGLKLQVCKPGFVDGRDAILKADT